jgi:hypothetical protein
MVLFNYSEIHDMFQLEYPQVYYTQLGTIELHFHNLLLKEPQNLY